MPFQNLASYRTPLYYRSSIPPVRAFLWYFVGLPLFRSFFPGSSWRSNLLRLFGTSLGHDVVIKPHSSIKYPWNLTVEKSSWLGEYLLIDNPFPIYIGANTCISQGVKIISGNHDYNSPTFDLKPGPITIGKQVWIGAFSIIAPSSVLASGTILAIGSVFSGQTQPYTIIKRNGSLTARTPVPNPPCLFHFIVPIKDPSPDNLTKLISSLVLQTYSNWRLSLILHSTNDSFILEKVLPEDESRITVHIESSSQGSIYNAMNEGLSFISTSTHICFLGGDDMLAHPDILEKCTRYIGSHIDHPDIIFSASCRYPATGRVSQLNSTFSSSLTNAFLGHIAPHQGLIYPSSLFSYHHLTYDTRFPIAADLELFLKLSSNHFRFLNLPFDLCYLGHSGVSSRYHFRRVREVLIIYYRFFGPLALVPFLMRYLRRIIA